MKPHLNIWIKNLDSDSSNHCCPARHGQLLHWFDQVTPGNLVYLETVLFQKYSNKSLGAKALALPFIDQF